ncbi:MAG: 3-phosphoserine/phosphohydroxythreonine transaminase [Chitinophagaceae bacterium]|nr:3-phosphoserine/phosphohydroxythreonine transaminase [Chitinophagaceae bacterium]
MTVHNFGAGPAILPKEVLEEAARAVVNYKNSGLSLLETGHRTETFQEVMHEARQLVRELMSLNDEMEVLFLHGGATLQFLQVPLNLLSEKGFASYTETGTWSVKAIREARFVGRIEIAGSSKENNYYSLPEQLHITPGADYLHITTNETISGTQWQQIPFDAGVPLVADMSSDILSRRLPFNRFALIYAGAQKNLGAAGVALVVVNKNLLGKTGRTLPTMMDYRNHIAEGSMLNTPPMFAVYVVLLTLRWLKGKGGVEAIEQHNEEKARLFYDTLDALPVFTSPVSRQYRSRMNAVFTINNPELEKKFLERCKAEGMIGVKGHRSVGGFRVSMYNALPLESVKAITDLMKDFANQYG